MLNADNSLLIVSCAFPVINKNELENKEKDVEREKKEYTNMTKQRKDSCILDTCMMEGSGGGKKPITTFKL